MDIMFVLIDKQFPTKERGGNAFCTFFTDRMWGTVTGATTQTHIC